MDYAALARWIGNDPRFEAAAYRICDGILACYEANSLGARLMGDRAQYHIIGTCYHLHPAATAGGILALLPPDTASRNRVSALLAALERCGALEPSDAVADKRARARKLSDPFRAWIDSLVEAITFPALPFLPRPPADLDDPAARQRWFTRWVVAQQLGIRLSARVPNVRRWSSLRGGHLVLLELMRREHAPANAELPRFSKRDLALRLGLSRTHLIDLLTEARGNCWVEDGPGGVRLTPTMRDEARHWQALHLAAAALTLDGSITAPADEPINLPPARHLPRARP